MPAAVSEPNDAFGIEHESARHLKRIAGLWRMDLSPATRHRLDALPEARTQQPHHADLLEAERAVGRLALMVHKTGVADVELLAELTGECGRARGDQVDLGVGSIEIALGLFSQLDELIVAGDSSVVAKEEKNRWSVGSERRDVDLAPAGIEQRNLRNFRPFCDHTSLFPQLVQAASVLANCSVGTSGSMPASRSISRSSSTSGLPVVRSLSP